MNSRRKRRLMYQIFSGPRTRFTRRERKAAKALIIRRYELSIAYFESWCQETFSQDQDQQNDHRP